MVKETSSRIKIQPTNDDENDALRPNRSKKVISPNRFLSAVKRPLDNAARERYQKIRKREVKPSRSQPMKNESRLPEIIKIVILKMKDVIK